MLKSCAKLFWHRTGSFWEKWRRSKNHFFSPIFGLFWTF